MSWMEWNGMGLTHVDTGSCFGLNRASERVSAYKVAKVDLFCDHDDEAKTSHRTLYSN